MSYPGVSVQVDAPYQLTDLDLGFGRQYGPPQNIYAPPTSGYTSPIAAPSGYPTSTYPGSTYQSSSFIAPPPAPVDSEAQLWAWFHDVNVDRSGEITIVELQRVLDKGDWKPFDLDTIKLLMQLFSTHQNGTIGFKEFSGIWKYIKDWYNVFRHFDRDRSETIDAGELRDALAHFGYRLTPRLIELIQIKYAAPELYSGGPLPGITFDRFVRACVVVKQITESFKRHDNKRDGWITIDYDGFMEMVLSLP